MDPETASCRLGFQRRRWGEVHRGKMAAPFLAAHSIGWAFKELQRMHPPNIFLTNPKEEVLILTEDNRGVKNTEQHQNAVVRSRLYHLLGVILENYLTSQCLSFVICQMAANNLPH